MYTFAMKKSRKNLSIAILGTRGIPSHYGGFETFAEQLSTRLVKRGFDVTVYCRPESVGGYRLPFYQGVRLVYLPTLRHKYLETVAHTFISTLHAVFTGVDIVYFCNAINASFLWIPRLFGKRTIINVNGLEWKRQKWSKLGKWAYQISEWLATVLAHDVISDSKRIQLYYGEKFGRRTHLISYGALGKRVELEQAKPVLDRYHLVPNGYMLYVSRLEPENNAHRFIEAYKEVRCSMPLVIVGSAPYGAPYIDGLRANADDRVIFLGGLYGQDYQALLSHAYVYLHGNEVGGTNPALLEAMACANCVLSIGVSFNREVVREAGVCFHPKKNKDLAAKWTELIVNPLRVSRYRVLAAERIKKKYCWDLVTDQYEELFCQIFQKRLTRERPTFLFPETSSSGELSKKGVLAATD
jgi:glycosyltransferase involved in cell wall biosynthesis